MLVLEIRDEDQIIIKCPNGDLIKIVKRVQRDKNGNLKRRHRLGFDAPTEYGITRVKREDCSPLYYRPKSD